MEEDVWGDFPEEKDPWDEFPEVNQEAPQSPSPAPPPPEVAPKENSSFVDGVTAVGARMLNPLGPVYDRLTADDSLVGGALQSVEDVAKGVVGGMVVEAPKNIAKTIASAATYSPLIEFYKAVTGSEGPEVYENIRKDTEEVTQKIDQELPEFTPQNTSQEVGKTGGEIAAGLVVGNKGQAALRAGGASEAAIQSLAQKAPQFTKYLADVTMRAATHGMAQAAGTAATLDEDTETLLVGPNAKLPKMFNGDEIAEETGVPIYRGIKSDDPEEIRGQLEKRFNILLDAMVLAGPIELIADGGKAIFGLLGSVTRPLRGAFLDPSGKYKEGLAMEQFVGELRNAIDPKNPGSQVADEYVSKVVDLLSNEKEAKMIFPDLVKKGADKTVEFDPTTIVNRGLANDSSEAGRATKSFFDRKRKEIIDRPNVQQTQLASERPSVALEEIMNEGVEAKGGEDAIRRAGTSIQDSGQSEIDRAIGKVDIAEGDLRATDATLGNILAEDEGLGRRMLEEGINPSSRIGVDRNRITSDIVEATREGNRVMSELNRANWQNIPEGLPIDKTSFAESLKDVVEAQAMSPSLKKALKSGGVDLDAIVNKADDKASTRKAIDIDFSTLQNALRSPLNKAISQAEKTGLGYEELLSLRRNIVDEQPEFLLRQKQKGTSGGYKALEEAVDYTRGTYGPNAKSGLPGKIKQIDQRNRLDIPKRDQEAFSAFESATKGDLEPVMKHYANVLARPEYGGKQGLIVDHALASAAEKMNTTLRVDGIVGIKPKEIIDSLRPYRVSLNSNPELFRKELTRIDEFERKLIENQANAQKLSALVKEYTKDAEKTKKKIYETSLKEWFNKEGERAPNAYQSFRSVFMDRNLTDKKNVGRLDDMISRMDPGAREGAVAAWLKYGRETLFNPDGTLNTTKAAETLQGRNNFLTIGKKLLPENEGQLVDVVSELLDPSMAYQIAKKSSSTKSGESIASSTAAKRAATRLVLATKGPLTKTGGRITSFVGTMLDYIKPDDTNIRIADAIMADRGEFLKLFGELAKRNSRSKDLYRKTFNFLVKNGVYNDQSEEPKFEEWYKKARDLESLFESEELFAE